MISRIDAIKKFFGTERPVTNAELIEFRKADAKGFNEIAADCAKALGEELTPLQVA